MTTRLKFKRGDTFALEGVLTDDDGPVDLTGWSVRSQLRDGDSLIAELDYVVIDAPAGALALRAAGTTADWPVKVLFSDVEITSPDGDVVSTETFQVQVLADVTRT